MGTQQLLLIVLGVIIVGIAVVVGIGIFGTNSQQANADAVAQDCLRIAANAQGYYRKPLMLGGGSNSFVGLTLAKCGWKTADNQNGSYALSSVQAGSFVVTGTGAMSTSVVLTVYPDSTAPPTITLN
jgi:hypothetical protein